MENRMSQPAPDEQSGDPHVLPMTAEAIEAWLVNRLAECLEVPPEEISIDEPFANYGLDSMAAVRLAGDLEDLAGRELPPTLVWDYPTIRAVSLYAASTEQPAAEAPQSEAVNP